MRKYLISSSTALLTFLCCTQSLSQTTGPAAPATGARAPVSQPATSASPSTPTPAARNNANNTNASGNDANRPSGTQTNSTNPTTRSDSSSISSTTNNPATKTTTGPSSDTSKPNCSSLKGVEKSECERRDSVRDDLPAGVTSSKAKETATTPPPKK